MKQKNENPSKPVQDLNAKIEVHLTYMLQVILRSAGGAIEDSSRALITVARSYRQQKFVACA